MKAPKNFYNTVDQRKLGLEDGLLPDVTAADNGKILKVTGGKWQPGSDSGSEVLTVAITYDSEQEEYSADKTHAQIVAAISGGSIVLATYDGRTYVYAGKNNPAAFDAVYFSYLQADSDDQFIGKIFEIDEDDRITYSEHDLNNDNVLPDVTSADYEKILQVDDQGNWIAALDRFHVGDSYRIPSSSVLIGIIGNVGQSTFQIAFTLPKYVDSNVKWASFRTNSKCRVWDSKGNEYITAWTNIDSELKIITQYSGAIDDSFQLLLKLKNTSFDANLTLNDVIYVSFSGAYLEFEAAKPTT